MKFKLEKAIHWQGQKVEELELDFEGLTAKDMIEIQEEAKGLKEGGIVLLHSTDQAYHLAVASKASSVPVETLGMMGARDFVSLSQEIQGFLLGTD